MISGATSLFQKQQPPSAESRARCTSISSDFLLRSDLNFYGREPQDLEQPHDRYVGVRASENRERVATKHILITWQFASLPSWLKLKDKKLDERWTSSQVRGRGLANGHSEASAPSVECSTLRRGLTDGGTLSFKAMGDAPRLFCFCLLTSTESRPSRGSVPQKNTERGFNTKYVQSLMSGLRRPQQQITSLFPPCGSDEELVCSTLNVGMGAVGLWGLLPVCFCQRRRAFSRSYSLGDRCSDVVCHKKTKRKKSLRWDFITLLKSLWLLSRGDPVCPRQTGGWNQICTSWNMFIPPVRSPPGWTTWKR